MTTSQSLKTGNQSDPLLTERDAAAYLSVSVAALRRWRFERRELRFVKVATAVRYLQSDLDAYVSARTQPVTCDTDEHMVKP